jgi:hypothetical protein
MKVTLKRADFYARAALKAATEAKYDATARLSIYSPDLNTEVAQGVANAISAARTKLLAQHKLSLDLIRTTYAIRAQLAHANTAHGISARLTENVRLAAEEARLRALLKAMEAERGAGGGAAGDAHIETSPEAVLAKAKAIREQPIDRYSGRDDVVSVVAFTPEDTVNVRKQIKRIVDERAGINDALTALNVSNSITLDSNTVETLRKADILPAE